MSHLQYYNYAGVGEKNNKDFRYSQAVRVGDNIICSGQGALASRLLNCSIQAHSIPGGWYGLTSSGSIDIPTDTKAQIDQAFVNVDTALKTAGGKGWSQVYQVRSYHLPLNNEALGIMTQNFKKWMPDHQPLYTCLGVTRLGEDDMRIEIEVVAHDPEGAKIASASTKSS